MLDTNIKSLSIVKDLKLDQIEELAEKGADIDDIGRSLNFSPNDWKAHRVDNPSIDEAIQRGKARLRISILSYQFEKAQMGDVKMLMWLGKQYLGQSEKAGEKKEVVSLEREKEAVKKAIKADPTLIKKIFAQGK